MSTFHLSVVTSGDAFGTDPEDELATILRLVAVKVSEGRTYGNVLDTNGNTCGKYWTGKR